MDVPTKEVTVTASSTTPGKVPPVSSPLETVPSVVDSADIVMADPPVKASPVDMAVKRTPNTSRPANPQILHPVQADAGMDEDARVPITDTAALPISPLVASDEPIGADDKSGSKRARDESTPPPSKSKKARKNRKERAIDVDVEAIIVDADLGRSSSEPEMVEDVIEERSERARRRRRQSPRRLSVSSGDEKEDKKADAIVYPPDKELRVVPAPHVGNYLQSVQERQEGVLLGSIWWIACMRELPHRQVIVQPDAEGFPRVASPRPPTPGTDGGAGSRESKGQKLPHPDPNSEARLRRGLYTLWMKTDISKGEMTTNNPRPKPRKVPPPAQHGAEQASQLPRDPPSNSTS
ncbi:hypothetical protein A0H81_09912 [Grifola frondosa]|uniref:Uncharacterized protein n=1 Tax=Grifola frondosa TaxID=5627 RepID=A0A1C7M0D0_GRIFR|nr:hypothetical protein A0H81_09912 [Grifola frondosa]